MCKHYWKIEPARGTTSKGKCKYCGEEREFLNGEPYMPERFHVHSEPRVLLPYKSIKGKVFYRHNQSLD